MYVSGTFCPYPLSTCLSSNFHVVTTINGHFRIWSKSYFLFPFNFQMSPYRRNSKSGWDLQGPTSLIPSFHWSHVCSPLLFALCTAWPVNLTMTWPQGLYICCSLCLQFFPSVNCVSDIFPSVMSLLNYLILSVACCVALDLPIVVNAGGFTLWKMPHGC